MHPSVLIWHINRYEVGIDTTSLSIKYCRKSRTWSAAELNYCKGGPER
jgi:hypothetical protein